MCNDVQTPAPPVGLRRWTRFSIRSLLLAMVLVSIALALWLKYLEPYRRQARAVAALRQLKTLERYRGVLAEDPVVQIKSEPVGPAWLQDWYGPDGLLKVTTLSLSFCTLDDSSALHLANLVSLKELYCVDTSLDDAEARHFGKLQDLSSLDLSRTNITDESLPHLAVLKELRELGLSETHVTDAGLEHLQSLSKLRVLNLRGCRITGRGIAWLKNLPQLEYVNLQETDVTDDDLRRLADLKRLKHLTLGSLPVTDEGLKHLAGLRELQSIHLHGTKVTNAALQSLRRLPALELLIMDHTGITQRAMETEFPERVPRRIRRVLAEPMNTKAPAEWTTLQGLLEYISSITGVSIQVDERALRAGGVDPAESVKVPLNGRVMKDALEELLTPRGLTWTMRHDMLVVTTPAGKLRPPAKLLQEADEPATEQLLESLAQHASPNFSGTPLAQVLAQLVNTHKVAIRIDEATMRDRTLPVISIRGRQWNTLRHWLEFVLDQHDLVGVIRGDTVWVRPAEGRPKGR